MVANRRCVSSLPVHSLTLRRTDKFNSLSGEDSAPMKESAVGSNPRFSMIHVMLYIINNQHELKSGLHKFNAIAFRFLHGRSQIG